jgi:hypothetical protein
MVNTFMPYEDFEQVAKVLDVKRLGKQRVEAMQIINIITDKTKTKGWRSHPVVKMWQDYPDALKLYYNTIVKEWIARSYTNNMKLYKIPNKVVMPWFVKCKTLHLSHQASLIRKEPEYYADKFKVPPKYMLYSYVWVGSLTPEQISELKANCDKALDISKYAVLYCETAAAKALEKKKSVKEIVKEAMEVV